MRRRKGAVWFVTLLMALTLAACNMGGGGEEEGDDDEGEDDGRYNQRGVAVVMYRAG